MVCLNCYIEFSQPAFLIFRYSVYLFIAVGFAVSVLGPERPLQLLVKPLSLARGGAAR